MDVQQTAVSNETPKADARHQWKAPELRRLSAGSAENGLGTPVDGNGDQS